MIIVGYMHDDEIENDLLLWASQWLWWYYSDITQDAQLLVNSFIIPETMNIIIEKFVISFICRLPTSEFQTSLALGNKHCVTRPVPLFYHPEGVAMTL